LLACPAETQVVRVKDVTQRARETHSVAFDVSEAYRTRRLIVESRDAF
jgi:hypothetical protein